MIYSIDPSRELRTLLNRFDAMNGVVQYEVIGFDEEPTTDYGLHQSAASLFMRLEKERFDELEFDIQKATAVLIDANSFQQVYEGAFTDPPYGLSEKNKDVVGALFSEINRHLFGGFHDELEIYSWSSDWSSYFDAGNEWWGAFLWTVRNRQTARRQIIVIAASTTD